MVLTGTVCALALTDQDTVRVRSLDGTLTYAETPYRPSAACSRNSTAFVTVPSAPTYIGSGREPREAAGNPHFRSPNDDRLR